MRILHFYPDYDSMIADYVSMLSENMGLECTNERVSESKVAQSRLKSSHYDIVHLHGCWRSANAAVVSQALKAGSRIVVSPYGQLEPWEMDERYWQEKLPKRVLYVRQMMRQAYAVVIQGKMEAECMQRLGWNQRTVIVKNALLTHSTSPEQMGRQMYQVYRRVMDSNTWELMDDSIRELTRQLIKIGITGDKRWLTDTLMPAPDTLEKWRLLLCYGFQQGILSTISRALNILEMEPPQMDATQIAYFTPDGYVAAQSIASVIGSRFASENERLLATFRYLKKVAGNHQLSIIHLVELDKELREHGYNEDQLCETLEEKHLYKFAARLMYVLQETTGLTEGFMPMLPCKDRTARNLCKQIDNYLKI